MAAEPKRITVSKDTKLEALVKEADRTPVIFEIDGKTYEMSPREINQSPFTARGAYASVTTVDGRRGSDISDDEMMQMIEEAKEEYVQGLVEKMSTE